MQECGVMLSLPLPKQHYAKRFVQHSGYAQAGLSKLDTKDFNLYLSIAHLPAPLNKRNNELLSMAIAGKTPG